MWNCSELEKSPRRIWQTSRYFLLHTQYHICESDFNWNLKHFTFVQFRTVQLDSSVGSHYLMIKKYFTAFGFCEYKEPESTLRALRLLHDLQIGDKNLLVKVDAKTKAQLDEWKAKKKTTNGVRLLYKVCSATFDFFYTSLNEEHCFTVIKWVLFLNMLSES